MWDERCSDDAQFVEFTPKLKKIILDAHNKLRNKLALGKTDGYPPAKRMATMVLFFFENFCIFSTIHDVCSFICQRHGTTN